MKVELPTGSETAAPMDFVPYDAEEKSIRSSSGRVLFDTEEARL